MKRNRSYCRALLLVLATTLLVACDSGAGIFDCDKKETAVASSRDGQFVATILLVQCGVTTSDATWVLVSPSSRAVDDENDRVAVFEGTEIGVEWVGGALEISYGDARVFKNELVLHGVDIRYVKREFAGRTR